MPGVLSVSGIESSRDWAIEATRQTDEAFGMCGQFVGSNAVLAGFCVFRHTQFHQGDETAGVLVTSAVAPEDGNRADVRSTGLGARPANSYLSADMCLDVILRCREMKARRSINPIAIEQGDRRHLQLNAGSNQFFRHRSTFEETKSGSRV